MRQGNGAAEGVPFLALSEQWWHLPSDCRQGLLRCSCRLASQPGIFDFVAYQPQGRSAHHKVLHCLERLSGRHDYSAKVPEVPPAGLFCCAYRSQVYVDIHSNLDNMFIGSRCTHISTARKCKRQLLANCWQPPCITDDSSRTTLSMSWEGSTILVGPNNAQIR